MLVIVEVVAFTKEAEGLCELASKVLGSSDLTSVYQFLCFFPVVLCGLCHIANLCNRRLLLTHGSVTSVNGKSM